jgi:hypothetical protein
VTFLAAQSLAQLIQSISLNYGKIGCAKDEIISEQMFLPTKEFDKFLP